MSAPDEREFELLLAAHGNRDLTEDEERRLRELAASDPARRREVEDVDGVHALFVAERALRSAVAAPAEPGEEADEGYQRMQRAAAAAGEELRARMQHPAGGGTLTVVDSARRRRLRVAGLLVAAAAAVVVWIFAVGGDGAPSLDTRAPSGSVLGGGADRISLGGDTIVLRVELSTADPELAWHDEMTARTYDAVIESRDGGEALVRRADELARETTWRLEDAEIARLRAFDGALVLRIVARDGAGLPVATSGDLPLTVR